MMKQSNVKRKSTSSLDALLKATATGQEQTNAIDKALNTPSNRIMKASIEFEKGTTITSSDRKDIKYTQLIPSVEKEFEAAMKLKKLGNQVGYRKCHVEPIPPAYLKSMKLFNRSN